MNALDDEDDEAPDDAMWEPEPARALEYEYHGYLPSSGSIMDPEFDELIQPPRDPFRKRDD